MADKPKTIQQQADEAGVSRSTMVRRRNPEKARLSSSAYYLNNRERITAYNSSNRLRRLWVGMNRRCFNPKHKDYDRYKDRGYLPWRHDYASFEKWALQAGYEDHLSIDRINNDLGYSPENCQWLTASENSRKGDR